MSPVNFLDPEVYQQAQAAAKRLQKELEPLILGRQLEPSKCGCGILHYGQTSAVYVEPAGATYQEQIGNWWCWSVKMQEDGRNPDLEPRSHYWVGLDQFIDSGTLREMFQRHFAGIPVEVN